MPTTDFSRIGELFYMEVGRQQQDISLAGFLRDAYITYRERYMHNSSSPVGLRFFQYPSDNPAINVTIAISASLGQPDIVGLGMQGTETDLHKLLPHLRGQFHAEYMGMPAAETMQYFGGLSENLARRIINQEGNQLHLIAGHLGATFGKNEGQLELKALTLQRKRRRLWHMYLEPRHIEDITLTTAEKELLGRAVAIQIENTGYYNDNVDQQMVQELCHILQQRPADYRWSYEARGVNNQCLPAHLFPSWEHLFSTQLAHFSTGSFRTVRITDSKARP